MSNFNFNPDEPEIDELMILAQYEGDLSDFEGCADFERIPAAYCERPTDIPDDFPF